MKPLTAREEALALALIDEQIAALRVAGRMTARLQTLIDELDRQLRRELVEPLGEAPPLRERIARIEQAIEDGASHWQGLMLALVVEWLPGFQSATARNLAAALPATRTLQWPELSQRIDPLALRIAGQPLAHWLRGHTRDLRRTMVQALRTDVPTGDVGLLDRPRRQLQQLVHASVMSIANQQREALYQANPKLVRGLRWLATLDGRACLFCAARDGQVYELDHRPRGHDLPWDGGPGACHFGCRCVSLPVLATWRELGVDMDEAPGTRASQDGQVPATLRFEQWLQSKPVAFQERWFGPGRARLWRAGQLTLSELLKVRLR